MFKTAAVFALTLLASSAQAETRYDFSYRNLYEDGYFLISGSGFSGYFVGNDDNLNGMFETAEVSDFVVDGAHFVGPQATCDRCFLSLNYTPGGSLVFNSGREDYATADGVFYYYNYYNNNGMSWGFDGFYSRRLEVGPETTVTITQVPEPTTYAMLLGGLSLLGFAARKRKAS